MVASHKQIMKPPKSSLGAVLVMKQQRKLLGCPANALAATHKNNNNKSVN
jgi:hypothetical protein